VVFPYAGSSIWQASGHYTERLAVAAGSPVLLPVTQASACPSTMMPPAPAVLHAGWLNSPTWIPAGS